MTLLPQILQTWRHHRFNTAALIAITIFITSCSDHQDAQDAIESSREQAQNSKISQAAVAMPDRYSAEVSAQILEQGGNAVDAAVAAAFTLAVTYPEAGNIAGGGFMTLRLNGETQFLDYREVAPGAATRDMFLDSDRQVIPKSSLSGHRASGVPGTVLGTVSYTHLTLPTIYSV